MPHHTLGMAPVPADPHLFLWLSYAFYLMLWVATGLAVLSLGIYFSNVWTHFVYPQAKQH